MKNKLLKFNPLEYADALTLYPQHLSDVTSWHEHIPFAFVLIQILSPKTFIELGAHKGDSYLAFCQAVDNLGAGTRCFAVDTWTGDEHAGHYGENIYAVLKAVHDPLYGKFSTLMRCTFEEALDNFSDRTIDLLHIDGLHTYEAVKHDFNSWLPKMSESGVILFHDITVHERDFGVWQLWEELKPQYPHFEFLYGYGLGIISVGTKSPQVMHDIFTASEEEQKNIQAFFYSLGRKVSLLSDKERVIAEKDRQIAEKDRQIQNLINTWSWKITAPLRSFSRILTRFGIMKGRVH